MSYRISETIELPAAESIDRATGDHWWRPVFRCSVCGTRTRRRNRLSLAGAYVCTPCGTDHNEWAQQAEKAHRDAENEKRWERNGWIADMQGYGDTSSPDSFDSPGALWLLRLHNDAQEAWEEGRFASDRDETEHELADYAVPIYTHHRWSVFTDLGLYDNRHIQTEGEVSLDNLTEGISGIMYDVARGALNAWVDAKLEASKCDECGELPEDCYCNEDENEEDTASA